MYFGISPEPEEPSRVCLLEEEGSRCFPISLHLQVLECKLFRPSEAILIILESFQISNKCLNKSCPRTIKPVFPNSCLGAALWWDSFCDIREGTTVLGAHYLFCKGYQQHVWDWQWLMFSKFNASSNFLDCAQRTIWVKAGDTIKTEALYEILTLLMHLFFLQLLCLFHLDHCLPLPLFSTGFLLSLSNCLSQTGHKLNKIWSQAELLSCILFESTGD